MRAASVVVIGLLSACLPPIPEDTPILVEPDTDVAYSGPTYHRDIAPLIAEHCAGCHKEGAIGRFSLLTYEDVVAHAYAIQSATADRRMPPWPAQNDGSCNTFDGARWLTDEQIATIGEWVYSGAVEGDPQESPPSPDNTDTPLQSIAATLDIGEVYTPNASAPDDYRCFVVDPQLSADAFLTGFEVKPGDARIVHHVVLFDVAADSAATVAELDAADPGPGYSCFGDSGANGSVLLAWAPGSPATRFPAGTGLPMGPGRSYVLQVHYNTIAGVFPDRTRVDLQLETTVENPAGFLFAVDMDLALPSGQSLVENVAEFNVGEMFDWFGWGTPEPLTLYGLFPHLHLLGRSIHVERLRGDEATCLLDVPKWDFHWQQMYFYKGQTIELQPTDRLRVRCDYDTSSATETVVWGEGTSDEMCVAGLYVSRSGSLGSPASR